MFFFVVENCQLVSFCFLFSVQSPSCFGGLCLLIESLFPGFFPGTLYGRNVGRQTLSKTTLSTVLIVHSFHLTPHFRLTKAKHGLKLVLKTSAFFLF